MFRKTVPVAEPPPVTELGEIQILESTAWGTSVLASVIRFDVADINSGESLFTTLVEIGNDAVVWPAATVTAGGTVAMAV